MNIILALTFFCRRQFSNIRERLNLFFEGINAFPNAIQIIEVARIWRFCKRYIN